MGWRRGVRERAMEQAEREALVRGVMGELFGGGAFRRAMEADLVQSGHVALVEAERTYDAERGRFETYAYAMVRYAMLRVYRDEARQRGVLLSETDGVVRDGGEGAFEQMELESVVDGICREYRGKACEREIGRYVLMGGKISDYASQKGFSPQYGSVLFARFRKNVRERYGRDGILREIRGE